MQVQLRGIVVIARGLVSRKFGFIEAELKVTRTPKLCYPLPSGAQRVWGLRSMRVWRGSRCG